MSTLRGIIHGKTIELNEEPNLPPGQQVVVTIRPALDASATRAGLQKAFGTWAEDAEELDEFLTGIANNAR